MKKNSEWEWIIQFDAEKIARYVAQVQISTSFVNFFGLEKCHISGLQYTILLAKQELKQRHFHVIKWPLVLSLYIIDHVEFTFSSGDALGAEIEAQTNL